MKTSISILAAVACLSLLAGAADSATTPSRADAAFLTRVLAAGRQEVAESTRAVSQTKRADVRKAAQDLAQAHTATNSELEAMATSRHVVVDEQAARAQEPEAAAYSDQAWLRRQLAAHRQAIQLFERESTSGQDRDVKAFAAKTLPALRDHLSMLERVSRQIG